MIVIDTSAVMAILLNEPEAKAFQSAIESSHPRRMSAGTLLELSIVTYGKMSEGVDLGAFVYEAGIEVVAFDAELARLAAEAYRRFGKGRHRAGLNFGDCFAYALARRLDAPLLCKGEDFAQTDIEVWRP